MNRYTPSGYALGLYELAYIQHLSLGDPAKPYYFVQYVFHVNCSIAHNGLDC